MDLIRTVAKKLKRGNMADGTAIFKNADAGIRISTAYTQIQR